MNPTNIRYRLERNPLPVLTDQQNFVYGREDRCACPECGETTGAQWIYLHGVCQACILSDAADAWHARYSDEERHGSGSA